MKDPKVIDLSDRCTLFYRRFFPSHYDVRRNSTSTDLRIMAANRSGSLSVYRWTESAKHAKAESLETFRLKTAYNTIDVNFGLYVGTKGGDKLLDRILDADLNDVMTKPPITVYDAKGFLALVARSSSYGRVRSHRDLELPGRGRPDAIVDAVNIGDDDDLAQAIICGINVLAPKVMTRYQPIHHVDEDYDDDYGYMSPKNTRHYVRYVNTMESVVGAVLRAQGYDEDDIDAIYRYLWDYVTPLSDADDEVDHPFFGRHNAFIL